MNTYQQESLASGATHLGAKGHAWRICPLNGNWQVYKLGAGWVNDQPSTQLTPMLAPVEQPPKHYIELVQSWERVKRCMTVHESANTAATLYDLREAMNEFDALMEQR